MRAYRLSLAACQRQLSFHAVHRLRIAIRRLLVCLKLLEVAQGDHPGVRGALRRQSTALGTLRNTQVQLQLINEKPQFAEGLKLLQRHLRKRKARQAKAARKALKSGKPLRRLQRWSPAPLSEGMREIERLGASIELDLQETLASLASLSRVGRLDPAALHRGRVTAREIRHTLEALRSDWRSVEGEEFLSKLRAFHQAVGQFHDRDLLLRRIERLIAGRKLRASSAQPFRTFLKSEIAKLLESISRPAAND